MRSKMKKPSKEKMSMPIRKLLRYCRRWLGFILFALVLAALGSILNLLGPDKVSDITNLIKDGLMGEMDLDGILRIALILCVLYGLGFLLNMMQNYSMATVTQYIARKLRQDISRKIDRLPLGYFDTTSYGNILSRVTNDVDTVSSSLSSGLASLISAITTFVGALVMMFYTSWQMALAGIGSTLLGFGFMSIIMGRSQKYFVAQQQTLGALNGHVEEIYSGHTVVRAYNAENEAKKDFNALNSRLYNTAWKSQFLSGLMMPLMGFLGNLGYVAVCIVGALLTKNGTIEFGTIVAFMIYIRLFTNPLSTLAQVATGMQSAAAASQRVFEFLEAEEMADESDKTAYLDPAGAKGDVEFSHVRFGYQKDKIIIHDFSARAKAGQKIAIVGPTGAGKTTLVNLLMRFYELDGGSISIDGVPISSLTRENVHSLFCMVLQDTWLFEGTVQENIVFSKPGVSQAEVEKACRAVGLHHFIRSLPQGYDTVLGDSDSLSAGQKQLMTIARAMIDDAPLLILDEATSSVDTRTEILIQKAMDKLTAEKTSFVIAHRLSTVRNADLILVMRDGDILESGKHEELLQKGGFYAELYNSQFEKVS